MYLCNIQFKLISTILQFIIFKYIQKKKKNYGDITIYG